MALRPDGGSDENTAVEVSELGPRAGKKIYSCKYCPKTFKRSEHCKRHTRSHTLERPFGCRYCGRQYARKDLLVRHERTIHADVYPGNDTMDVSEDTISRVNPPKLAGNTSDGAIQVDRGDSTADYFPPTFNGTYTNSWQVDEQPEVLEQLPLIENGQRMSSIQDEGHVESMDTSIDPGLVQQNPQRRTSSVHWQHDLATGAIENTNILQQIEQPYRPPHTALSGSSSDGYQQSLELNGQIQDGLGHFSDVNFFELFPDDFPGMDLPNFEPVEAARAMGTASANYVYSLEPRGAESVPPVTSSSTNVEQDTGSNPFNRLPKVVKEPRESLPLFTLDDHKRTQIMEDLTSCMLIKQKNDQLLPTASSLQKFLNSYISSFHPHFPIFHLHSFKINESPNPLILSICAIGALYRLERETALQLYEIAQQASDFTATIAPDHLTPPPITSPKTRRPSTTPGQRPVWVVQCKLLLLFFASFSGDPVLVRSAIERLGLLGNEYRIRMLSLTPKMRRKREPNWQGWIERETSKRLLYAIFVLSSLISITYGVPPGIVLGQDAELEMPDDESLWNSKTAEEWQEHSMTRRHFRRSSVNEALGRLLYGKDAEDSAPDSWEWSPFATTIVMHAVAVHMWSIMQATQSFNIFSSDANDQELLKSLFRGQIDKALSRCHMLIMRARPENETTWIESEYPLLFNCLALLRMSYVKAFTSTAALNRMILLSDKPSEVAITIKSFVASKQARSVLITKAVNQAFEGLLIPMKAGHLLIKKTAALSWSIEHAIAAWDCALFFTKWVHCIESERQRLGPVDDSELETIKEVQNLLEESGDDEGTGSLAGQVTRLWASFFDDTWVWGVTPRMGTLLRTLAAQYDDDWVSRTRPH